MRPNRMPKLREGAAVSIMSNRQTALMYCICLLFVSSVASGCVSESGNETAPPTTTEPPTTTLAPTEPSYTVQLQDAWGLDIGAEPAFPPILVGESICVATEKRILLISSEGNVLWDEPLSGEVRYAPVTYGDLIYLVYADGSVEQRDGSTGDTMWKRSVDARESVPVCAYGKNLYVSSGKYLLCMHAESGDIAWRVDLPEGAVYSCIVRSENKLLVDTYAHNVTVVDAETGAILDEWDARCDMENLFVHDDSVYAMGGFCLTCLDADTGGVRWEYEFIEEGGSWTPAFVSYPYAFVSTIDDTVLCVDMESGDPVWSDDAMYRAGLAISGDVLISGIAYIPDLHKIDPGMQDPNSVTPPGTPERELVVWDIHTGQRVMEMSADQGLKWPVAIGNRFVFVTGTSLKCYALEHGDSSSVHALNRMLQRCYGRYSE